MMLFDEPTSALDPELRHEVLKVMQDLAEEGMTMVIVTHEIGFAEKVASRLIFIDKGRIAEDGDPQMLVNNPPSPRLREFPAARRLIPRLPAGSRFPDTSHSALRYHFYTYGFGMNGGARAVDPVTACCAVYRPAFGRDLPGPAATAEQPASSEPDVEKKAAYARWPTCWKTTPPVRSLSTSCAKPPPRRRRTARRS
jgi:ABC-type glutathione transport system ATPase component